MNLRHTSGDRIRRWLTLSLTCFGALITLATSSGPTVEENFGPFFDEEIWASSLLMGKDEGAGQVILSFPMALLDEHVPQLKLDVVVEIDQLEHNAMPGTDWSITLGDLQEQAFAFTTESMQLPPLEDPDGPDMGRFHWPWIDVEHRSSEPITIATDPAACDTGACVPCDGIQDRCEVALTLAREGTFHPRVKVALSIRMAEIVEVDE
ncbi:MAG: hypothetical protein VYE15_07365 [Myxococcota bacterium]|nr:hypothetical protein [Myxococcota bacterium]